MAYEPLKVINDKFIFIHKIDLFQKVQFCISTPVQCQKPFHLKQFGLA